MNQEQQYQFNHCARINSRRTAIARKALSAPVRLLKEKGLLVGRVLDFGCGKGFDADELGFEKYDPYHHPVRPKNLFDTVVCIYVLNVLPPDDRADVVRQIRAYLKKSGVAYIAVRRDIKKQGITSKGTLQWNAALTPNKHGADTLVHRKGKFRIYKITRT